MAVRDQRDVAVGQQRLGPPENPGQDPAICILERGKEWQPGEYPESLAGVVGATRGDPNPLGLYELLNYPTSP